MNLDKKLFIGIILNFGFTFIEMNIGYLSGSLSLISDAFCNLTDVISLIISFFALKLSRRKPDNKRTFGYGRITVLASLLNIIILLIIITGITYQAYYKFFNPEPIKGYTVIIVGLMGIIINGSVALSLLKNKNNLAIKAALFNLTLDVLASFGALVSGIIITLTNKTFIDPLISLTIAAILVINAFKILIETINILLESVPQNLNPTQIEATIQEFKIVKKIDNLHLWSISNYEIIMICHVYLDHQDFINDRQIIKKIKTKLKEQFDLYHMTLEVHFLESTSSTNTLLDNSKSQATDSILNIAKPKSRIPTIKSSSNYEQNI